MSFNIVVPFFQNALRSPEQLGLSVDQRDLSYGELSALSERIAAWLEQRCASDAKRVGIRAEHCGRIGQAVIEVHDQKGGLKEVQDLLAQRQFEVTAEQDPQLKGTPPIHRVRFMKTLNGAGVGSFPLRASPRRAVVWRSGLTK